MDNVCIIENFNLKQGVSEDDFISALKKYGYEVRIISTILTKDGRTDMLVGLLAPHDRWSFTYFMQDFFPSKLKRHVKEWGYHGMGKFYDRKEILKVRKILTEYKEMMNNKKD